MQPKCCFFLPIQTLRAMVLSSDVVGLLETAIQMTESTLGKLSAADFMLLRHTLCRFFQDKVLQLEGAPLGSCCHLTPDLTPTQRNHMLYRVSIPNCCHV